MKRVARSAIVEFPSEVLYALVEDIESYPRFLPWCLAAEVHERSAERTVATLTVGVHRIRQAFSTENENRPHSEIRMRLLRGPFRRFGAVWRFTPLGERAAKIDFVLEYEFASRVLARTLEPLFDRIADTMVDAFVQRARALHDAASR